MVDAGSYLLGAFALIVLALSLGFSAVRLRRILLSTWDGAPARLVEAVFGVALFVWLCEVLGLFGLLYGPLLIIAAVLLAVALSTFPVPSVEPVKSPDGPGPVAVGVTVAVIALVFAHWGVWAEEPLEKGIVNWDSLSFHMPFAADIAQSHSVGDLHYVQTIAANWFYPENSELFHAVGILLAGHDTLSLFINFGWLAFAFLAAWCVGRPYGRGHLTVVAAAILFECNTFLLREPGSGKNDIMEVALLLAGIAILINAWEREGKRPDGVAGTLPLGWPLAAAGLAVGLAAGTRVTALALTGALTIAVVALAPAGRRWVAAGWWSLAALAGGGFWYLRNLIVAGNPIPEIESVGPISLPHPERVQSGWPDYNVAHYITDGKAWSDYLSPGLEYSFGTLWPLVVGGAIAGAVLAVGWGRNNLLRWLGAVSLLGLLAYLFTPHSAGGVEGSPLTFAINTRFAIPALLLGLILLPLARGLEDAPRRWALLAALLAVLIVTDRPLDLFGDSALLLGLAVAFFAVLVPTALILARRWGASSRSLAVELSVVGVILVAIGYPVQNDYLDDRYSEGVPWFQLDSSYRWARDIEGARIGLAGTTAGVIQYGYYGPDSSNRVQYLGVRGPHGAFNPIPTCSDFRAAVNAADLDYLVTAPFLNYIRASEPLESPEAEWLRGEPAAEAIDVNGPVTVWRVSGSLDPAACGQANEPLEYVPQQPEA